MPFISRQWLITWNYGRGGDELCGLGEINLLKNFISIDFCVCEWKFIILRLRLALIEGFEQLKIWKIPQHNPRGINQPHYLGKFSSKPSKTSLPPIIHITVLHYHKFFCRKTFPSIMFLNNESLLLKSFEQTS